MPKLQKMYWYNSKGEKKVKCYMLTLSKDTIQQTNIQDQDNVLIHTDNKKIIIEKEEK